VLGGGRYDGLIETLGGPHTPAVGWAAGIERLAMLVTDADGHCEATADVALIPMGQAADASCMGLAARLRRAGLTVDMGFRGNMKKRMSRANESGACFAVIVGDEELRQSKATVKNLRTGDQVEMELVNLDAALVAAVEQERFAKTYGTIVAAGGFAGNEAYPEP
jgi:histidyl-tRNA synthetase